MTYTITLPTEYTHEDIEDATLGNGSLSAPWYNGASIEGDMIWVSHWLDDDEGGPYVITHHKLSDWAVSAEAIAAEYPFHARYIAEKDIDSELGDMIIQKLIYGTVVWG